MKRFQRIGLFMTGSRGDDEALAFAARFAELADSQLVRCIHVQGAGDDPHAAPPEKNALRRLVRAAMPDTMAERIDVEVDAGGGVRRILRHARDESLDLIVVGRPLPTTQVEVGASFAKLARKAPCDVLVVPNFAQAHLARVLVPVDCSEHSRLALETALAIARGSGEPNPHAIVQTIVSVGYGYRSSGVDFAEALHNVEAASDTRRDKFLAPIDTSGVRVETICNVSERVAQAVNALAAVRKMDLIVIGSRGRSAAATAILGSTAEHVVLAAAQPVLVVKNKGETLGLLDALLGG